MKLLLVTIILFSFQAGFSQEIYDKLSKKLCKCIEKENVTTMAEMRPCFEKIIIGNLASILEYHDAKSISEVDGEEVASRLTGRLAKNCEYAILSIVNDTLKSNMPKHERDSVLDCSNLKVGEYYYLTPDKSGELKDTTFVTFSESRYMERMKNGKTYSMLSVKWKGDCHFVLTFIESNDPLKGSYSKPGDTYEYEIIKNNKNFMVAKPLWRKDEFLIEFYKVKP